MKNSSEKLNEYQSFSQAWLANFVDTYQQLSTTNLHLLEQIYHKNITFTDPLHTLHGYDELRNYFNNLYTNLSMCDFVIQEVIESPGQAAIYWTMDFKHDKLNKGNVITVEGSSYLKGEGDKILYHRDYLDLGQMLYQQLPVIGKIIQWIKNRACS